MHARIVIEAVVGASEPELDAIIALVVQARRDVKTRAEFEKLANQRLKDAGHPIKFDRNNATLNRVGVPGLTDEHGQVVIDTNILSFGPQGLGHLRQLISHELVHVNQMAHANARGSAAEMFASSERRFHPGGQDSPLDHTAYMRDKQEIMAYARSAVDHARRTGLDGRDALDTIIGHEANRYHPDDRKRFLRYVSAYLGLTETLHEGRWKVNVHLQWLTDADSGERPEVVCERCKDYTVRASNESEAVDRAEQAAIDDFCMGIGAPDEVSAVSAVDMTEIDNEWKDMGNELKHRLKEADELIPYRVWVECTWSQWKSTPTYKTKRYIVRATNGSDAIEKAEDRAFLSDHHLYGRPDSVSGYGPEELDVEQRDLADLDKELKAKLRPE